MFAGANASRLLVMVVEVSAERGEVNLEFACGRARGNGFSEETCTWMVRVGVLGVNRSKTKVIL